MKTLPVYPPSNTIITLHRGLYRSQVVCGITMVLQQEDKWFLKARALVILIWGRADPELLFALSMQ